MRVQILEWKKLLGRSDIRHPRWFNFSKDIYTEPKFIGKATPAVIAVYTYAASMALGSEDGTATIVPAHLHAYTGLTVTELEDTLKALEELEMISVTSRVRTEPVRDPNGSVRNPYAEHNIKEGKGREHDVIASEPDAPELTYEPCTPDGLPLKAKPKKERKQKLELPCVVLPELMPIREILEARKVPTILQERWLKIYAPRNIISGVQKADTWAISKGEEKKNWGMFFNNWLSRDSSPRQTPPLQAATPPASHAPRKSFYVTQLEAQAKEEKK